MLPFRRIAGQTLHRTSRRMASSSAASKDLFVAVSDGTLASPALAANAVSGDLAQLWKSSNAKDKDTRTFYNVDGKTVVAVGLGKKTPSDENALKEQSRRAVRSLSPVPTLA